jgi:hypothetical protein
LPHSVLFCVGGGVGYRQTSSGGPNDYLITD